MSENPRPGEPIELPDFGQQTIDRGGADWGEALFWAAAFIGVFVWKLTS